MATKQKKPTVWQLRLEKAKKRREAALKTVSKLESQGYSVTPEYKQFLQDIGTTRTRYSERDMANIQNLTNANVIKSRAFKTFNVAADESATGLADSTSIPANVWAKSPTKAAANKINSLMSGQVKATGRAFASSSNFIAQNLIQSNFLGSKASRQFIKQADKTALAEDPASLFTPDVIAHFITEHLKEYNAKHPNEPMTEEEAADLFIRQILSGLPATTAKKYKKYRTHLKTNWIAAVKQSTLTDDVVANMSDVAVSWLYDFLAVSVWWQKNKDKLGPSDDFMNDFIDIFSKAEPGSKFVARNLDSKLIANASHLPSKEYRPVLKDYRYSISSVAFTKRNNQGDANHNPADPNPTDFTS